MLKALKRFALDKTYKIWHPPLNKCLSSALERGVINSYQWHELAAMFDRTQKQHYLMEKVP